MVKRICAELHGLSAQVTRTRKVGVQEEKPLREPTASRSSSTSRRPSSTGRTTNGVRNAPSCPAPPSTLPCRCRCASPAAACPRLLDTSSSGAGQTTSKQKTSSLSRRSRSRPACRPMPRDFRSGAFEILLASRVASEGLDFEFCAAVVNYDLPWNPMEVEQRIGRIDRIGQVEKKIGVLNFHTPGTIETDIIERVMERIGIFEHGIGELEPIFDAQWKGVESLLSDFALDPEQRGSARSR